MNCTACSAAIIDAIKIGGCEFLKSICDNPVQLEDISGIKAMSAHMDDAYLATFEDSDDDVGSFSRRESEADEEDI